MGAVDICDSDLSRCTAGVAEEPETQASRWQFQLKRPPCCKGHLLDPTDYT